MNKIVRFLEVIAGREQDVKRLQFGIGKDAGHITMLDAYWSMNAPPSGEEDDENERSPMPFDLPIQAARTPEHFVDVMTKWLAMDDERHDARSRFASAFRMGNRFTVDRLVAASNMFDILPASAAPKDVALSQELIDAKTKGQEIFRALPASAERSSVLNAFGKRHTSLSHPFSRIRVKYVAEVKLLKVALATSSPQRRDAL